MKRALATSFSLYARNHLSTTIKTIPNPLSSPILSISSTSSKFRFFSSSENNTSNQKPESLPETKLAQTLEKDVTVGVEDIGNKELKLRMEKYFKGDEEVLPSILEAILKRKLMGKHEDTDEELRDELHLQPLDDVKDKEFESDFEELYETDEEIENLYNARQIVEKRMVKDEYFNMDEKKWDEMIKEATEKGFLKDTGECERILEDMLSWDKLLPVEIKKKVEEKFEELGDMCEKGDLEPKQAYDIFKEFEDEMVLECSKLMEANGSQQLDDTTVPDKKKNINDPPGEGPILRWQTRVVFAPGGDAWHPKNRKVKMGVTVKELGLSKHQFRRLRELAGKRYHSGKDELMITSERFEHREENRKDCLRTLLSLIEESAKAAKLVDDARTSYVKDRLRANPAFMERLRAKTTRQGGLDALPA